MSINTLDAQNIFEYLVDESSPKAALIPEYYKSGKFVTDVEVQIRQPEGILKWVLLSLFSFKDAKRKRRGLLTLVDITKQKLIDKAKTEFVSLASHQLRTPISSMKWNMELLQTTDGGGMDEAQQAYLEKVNRSLGQMDMLVEDFLNVSKFELGTLTPKYEEVDVTPFLQGISDEHRDSAERKNIHVESTFEGGTIQSDTHFLHMIASNLLGNAIKYTPEGGRVEFKTRFDATNLILTVADSGIGIPPDDQSTIFTKMFRATNAQTHATEGTGLGLYIVKESVKMFGGSISFESKESVGTVFTVLLPKQH